jgi:uncharacterized GH25 family protein
MKKNLIPMVVLTAFLWITAGSAFAHNLWINPSDHFPKVGETVDIAIAWGHTYKAARVDQDMKPGNLAFIAVQGPDGNPVTPATVSETLYTLKITKPGAYLITAGIKPGVFTKTAEGRKWSDKRGVKDPISCTSFRIEAKSILIAGGKDTHRDGVTGRELEVIPLTNPALVKAGGSFQVKVLFKGKPAENVIVNATYPGFAEEGNGMGMVPQTPEKAMEKNGSGHKGPKFPSSAITDSAGKASLVLSRKGYWMITISNKTPYPDTTVCDEFMDNTAFTFEIR